MRPAPAVSQAQEDTMKRMFKLMFESLMEGERTALLGYAKHDLSTTDLTKPIFLVF